MHHRKLSTQPVAVGWQAPWSRADTGIEKCIEGVDRLATRHAPEATSSCRRCTNTHCWATAVQVRGAPYEQQRYLRYLADSGGRVPVLVELGLLRVTAQSARARHDLAHRLVVTRPCWIQVALGARHWNSRSRRRMSRAAGTRARTHARSRPPRQCRCRKQHAPCLKKHANNAHLPRKADSAVIEKRRRQASALVGSPDCQSLLLAYENSQGCRSAALCQQ